MAAGNDNNKKSKKGSSLKNVIPDTVITASVKAQILADEKLKVMDIKVETVNGAVCLNGVLGSKNEVTRAISIAQNVDGVKRVISKLIIKPNGV